MRSAALPFLLALFGTSCSPRQIADSDWTPTESPDLGAVVAWVGRVPIFAKQAEAEVKKAGKSPRAALEDLIESNLLAERARQGGLIPMASSDSEVKRALVQRFLEKELEARLQPEAVPDSVLRPLYDRALDNFVHPRLVEIGVLGIYTGAPMRDEPRQTRAGFAKELAVYLEKHPAKTLDEFAAVARDPYWVERHVTFTRKFQSPDKPFPKEVGIEAAKLQKQGDITPLVSTEDGYFIARYIDERPPENVTFEQARGVILLAGYYEHWRRQQFLEFTNKLMQAHKVEAHFDRLSTDEKGP